MLLSRYFVADTSSQIPRRRFVADTGAYIPCFTVPLYDRRPYHAQMHAQPLTIHVNILRTFIIYYIYHHTAAVYQKVKLGGTREPLAVPHTQPPTTILHAYTVPHTQPPY